ncbi:hypothetical protein A4X06_0g6089 [Tilletia controversa]|uniref:Zn(2)-C6 fungal-type domain-containing protein n=1 Tax=Tilletia controversa TaxID=13291 RepID=A0A8X7SVM8_9BASI|nr:hypothetical protein CF328_g1051 [Tilletia controversa]KAE8243831.1 hypothetical protein A4X06_0g6089 [Tilletia controversa]
MDLSQLLPHAPPPGPAGAEHLLHPHQQLQTQATSASASASTSTSQDNIHPPMLPTRQPPKKRNRAALSCTSCRERKIKCSRQIPCDQCTKRGDHEYCRMAPHPAHPQNNHQQQQQQQSWFDTSQSYDLFPFTLPSASANPSSSSINPPPPAPPAAAAVEFAAIKERLAQLEASLAHAQLQAAHNAAVAAQAGISVEPIPSPSSQAILAHRRQQQQQQQQAPAQPQTEGDGVDSDTEDAAAVLEGLAMGRKKRGYNNNNTAEDLAPSQPTPSSSSASNTGSISTAHNTSSTTTLPSSAATSPAEAACPPQRFSAFQRLLEADKQRDLMLPDGRETEHDHDGDDDAVKQNEQEQADDDDAVQNRGPASTTPAAAEDGMDLDSDELEVDAQQDNEEEAAVSPSTSSASAESAPSKPNGPNSSSFSFAQRTMDQHAKVLSSAYKDMAAAARERSGASSNTTPVPGSVSATSTSAMALDGTAVLEKDSSVPTETVPTEGTVDQPTSTAESGAALTSTPSTTTSTSAPSNSNSTSTQTHIRGPTATAYDLAKSHQGLFRIIIQGESMLGFGLGWPFAAAEENGDYKIIKGIGACPGNTQREAVLRAIIRTVPEREVVDQLLNVWEENVSFLAGRVIHVPTLRKEIETFFAFDSVEKRARVVSYVDPGWLAVLLMVFVTAIQFWPCNSTRSPTLFDGRSQGMWYAASKSALVLARYQSSQSLSVLQSIILINLHAQEPGRVNTALMRIAINNAMDLRLHRLGDVDKALGAAGQKDAPVGPCAFVRRQIELRIWWALVFRDWSSSACTGHYVINPEYFNTPLPANLNEHELCQTPTPQTHPINTPTEMSYVLANLEMAKAVRLNTDLLNKASIQSGGRNKGLRSQDEEVLDKVYRSVLSTAPSFFQAGSRAGEGTNLEVQRWLFVQAVFHKLLNVHRRRISSRAESRVTCVLLARSILDMQSKLRQRCSLINRMCMNLMQSFSAASVLCLDLLQSPTKGAIGADPALRDAIRSEVSEALEALRSVAEENHTAQRMFRIIEALLAEEEHRWNTASSPAAGAGTGGVSVPSFAPTFHQQGQGQQQQQANQAGQKRKRADESDGGSAASAAQGKKELLRLARRVAEAAQDTVPNWERRCPLAEHAARRAREAKEAGAVVDVDGDGEQGDGAAAHLAAGQLQQPEQEQQQHQQQQPMHSLSTSMSMASGYGVSGQVPVVPSQLSTQFSQMQTSGPFIYPTPTLAENPQLPATTDFASNTAPTTQQPPFLQPGQQQQQQQYALAPNGLDLPQAPVSSLDGFGVGFDLEAFLASISSSSPGVAQQQQQQQGQQGQGQQMPEAVQWLNSAPSVGSGSGSGMTPDRHSSHSTANVDLFNFGGINPMLPSPSASASTSSAGKGMQQQQQHTMGASAFQQQTMPTPPQSDSAGSSSGQSPPSSAGAGGVDSSNDWFWNWVLGQGAVGHAPVVAADGLPGVQSVIDQVRAQQTQRQQAADVGAGGGGTQYSTMTQPQQQQQQDPTTLVSSNFLPVPPLSSTHSSTAAGAKTPNLRGLPGTPSSYFSLNSFFAPQQGQGDAGAHSEHSQQQQQQSMGLSNAISAANLGTPSASLPSGSNPTSSSTSNLLATTTTSDPSSNSNSGAGSGMMSMEDFGQWMQAPSLFDFAGDLGIAEDGASVNVAGGYNVSSMMMG